MNAFYNSVSPAVRNELSKYEERLVFPPDTTLIAQGAIPQHLLIIEHGQVEISFLSTRKVQLTTTVKAGKVLALRAILTNTAEEFGIRTLDECAIIRIPADIFLELLRANPAMYLAVAKVLCDDLGAAERLLRHVRTVKNRRTMVQRIHSDVLQHL
jgi:CRP-like cAMP-binding protein